MTIILIIPPNPFLEDEKRNCPLGILYVAASLEKAGHEVQVVDLRGQAEEGWERIPASSIYGITSSAIDFPYAVEVARFLRARQPCKIVIGGPATLDTKSCLDAGFVVVKGEGEGAIPRLFSNNGQVINNGLIDNLDSIPFPARHLLPKESVVSTKLCHQGVPATTITASRGCPFNCTYCASPRIWHRRVRRHSPEYTIREVTKLVNEYGVKELRFQDDEMNLDREWLEAIAPAMADLGIKWRCHARAELGNWECLKEAGCYQVGIGVETTNPKAHKIHKGSDLRKTKEDICQAYQAGLELRLCFIVGLPYDDGDISGRTIQFLDDIPEPRGVFLNIFSLFPGSEISDNPQHFGLRPVKPPMSNVPRPHSDEPEFSFEQETITNDELVYHYRRLRQYIREKGWLI